MPNHWSIFPTVVHGCDLMVRKLIRCEVNISHSVFNLIVHQTNWWITYCKRRKGFFVKSRSRVQFVLVRSRVIEIQDVYHL